MLHRASVARLEQISHPSGNTAEGHWAAPNLWFEKRRSGYTLYLEVGAGDALGQLSEQRLHDLDELRGLDDVQDLLQLIEEHHLLGTVGLGPVLEQSSHSLQRNQSLRFGWFMGWMYGLWFGCGLAWGLHSKPKGLYLIV